MENQRNFFQTIKQRSRQIVTISLLAGALVLPWNAAKAEPSAFVEFNCTGYSVLAVGAPDDGYPHGVTRIMCRLSVYSLQTNADTPNFLHQPAPEFINTYEPGFAVDEAGFLPVFSW